MPRNISDTLIVLNVLSQVKKTIGISMGDLGRYTRVVAPLFGSPITFASIDTISAPGQLDIHTTKNFLDKIVR
jgi:3-dehydroquinate dehydratase-1